jgi:D-hydroxyproline dehydrogenase subunit gamma
MLDQITVRVNGEQLAVSADSTVAVAVVLAGQACRRSVTGEPRWPVCGMGICFECRVSIAGTPHVRSCQVLCVEGMDISTE